MMMATRLFVWLSMILVVTALSPLRGESNSLVYIETTSNGLVMVCYPIETSTSVPLPSGQSGQSGQTGQSGQQGPPATTSPQTTILTDAAAINTSRSNLKKTEEYAFKVQNANEITSVNFSISTSQSQA
jgi:hypothetical protein